MLAMLGDYWRQCFCVGLMVVFLGLYLRPVEVKNNKYPKLTVKITGTVPRVKWTSEAFANAILKSEPCVFRDSPVLHEWAAMKLWDFDYLRDQFGKGELKDVFVNTRSYFGPYFSHTRPLAKDGTVERPLMPHLYALRNMSAARFFKQLHSHRGGGKWHFYAGHVQDNIGAIAPQLADDIMPLDLIDLQADSESFNVNLWIGPAGVTTHAHYDMFTNLNVQIRGAKRWTLISPQHAPEMYLFPFMHPSHAQTQASIHPDLYDHKEFPLTKEVPALQVILQQGEVLYLPSMWIHHVETLRDSVNVNAWAHAKTEEIVKVLFVVPTPLLDNTRAPKLRYYLTRRFIEHFLRNVGHKPRAFVVRHVLSRYSHLMETGVLVSLEDVGSPFCTNLKLSQEFDDELRSIAESSAKLALNVNDLVRDVIVSNFIEFLSLNVVPAKAIGAYLDSCFVESE